VASVIYGSPTLSSHAEENAEIIHRRMAAEVLKLAPASILEVGAGRGKLGAIFAGQGIRYVGIEPVQAEFDAVREHHPELNVIHASCYDDPATLNLGKFDLVYSNDVVEHLYDPRGLVRFSVAHLNPGGRIVCGTPHYGSYTRNLILSLANRWEKHHNPLWDGGHIKFFSKKSMYQLWLEGGFSDFTWGELRSPRLPLAQMYLYCAAILTQ
jgi:2-polyprenyl-3-methyl-5-hydroxy-6-metoxy-1,4-benzoquinol methylase